MHTPGGERRLYPALAGLVAAALAAGCAGASKDPPTGTQGSAGSSGGGGGSGGSTFVEAAHAPLPQLKYQGGPLLVSPSVVTVTFAGDANAPALGAFDDDLVASPWWDAVTAGFCNEGGACVGRGTSGGHYELTTAAAASYTDGTDGASSTLQTFLADAITQSQLPAPGPNTLYVLYVPSTTTITITAPGDQPTTSCDQFTGYHDELSVAVSGSASLDVPYAVVPECAPKAGSNLDPLQALTFAASHEILESVTDPGESFQDLGYYLDLTDHTVLGWNLLSGGEAADLCDDVTGLGEDQTTSDGYMVQRIWSNASALAGLDPCVPSPGPTSDVYFNVAPSGSNAFVVLDLGQSATFEADAFSSAPLASWTLEGVDWESKQGQVTSPLLSFTFGGQTTATVTNGDEVQVTVTLDADPSQFGGAEGLLLSSTGAAGAPSATHFWPILVVTPDEAKFGPTAP